MALYIGNQKVAPTMLPSGGVSIPLEVSANGELQKPTSSFTWSLPSSVTQMNNHALASAFYGCTGLISVDLSSLITIPYYGESAMSTTFYQCTNLTSINLSSLKTISASYALNYTFQDCTSLTSVDLSSLTTISGQNYALLRTFYGCTSLTNVDLSSLITISGANALAYIFSDCTNLTNVDLSGLTTISNTNALGHAFDNCISLTTLSFPSLTSTSFGSYTNQFNSMLSGVTGCTVHFPSNLQSVIGSWTSVTSGFGGTNTTVLFDLPATT